MKICQFCNKEYTSRKKIQKNCSRICTDLSKKGKSFSPNTQFKPGCIPIHKKDKIKKICKCGKEFEVKASLVRVRHCSQSCAKKGITSSRKGAITSKETKEKQRAAKLGIRGSDHWNYKGYQNKTARKIAMSQDEYKQWRLAVFKRDNYTCQKCNIKGDYLNADHIVPWCASVELRYDVNNGRTLCIGCHKLTDTYGGRALKYKEVKNG